MTIPKEKNGSFLKNCALGFLWSFLSCKQRPKGSKRLSTNMHSKGRNSNELGWTLQGLDNYSVNRWDCLYRNQSKLRCNLRVKYEELRILWGRQELNRYKSKYAALKGGNSVACSYCQGDIETEQHLYNDCVVADEF